MQQITSQFIKQCLLTSDDYRQTKIIKQAVQTNQEHLFETICITIKEVLAFNPFNDPNPPMAKLQAVRLSKELIDFFNTTFVNLYEKHTLEQFIYYSQFGDPNDENRGKQIFGENSDKNHRQIGISIVRFTSECINAWAQFFPTTPSGQPTKFIKLYQDMQNKGFKFPIWAYYKEDFVISNSKREQNQKQTDSTIIDNSKGAILERQKIFILGCEKLLDYIRESFSRNEKWGPEQFTIYQNEIISKNSEVEILINQLRGIKEQDLAQQIIEQVDKLKSLEKDLTQLNKDNYIGFRQKYMKNINKGGIIIQEEEQKDPVHLHQPSGFQNSQIQTLQAKIDQLQQEKIQLQNQLSIIQKQFNDSEKLRQQQKEQNDIEINNQMIEKQKLFSEKQAMLSQIEQLNTQLKNGIQNQNNQLIAQLQRDIEKLKQDKELQLKNLQDELDKNQLKVIDQQHIQDNLNLQLNQYKVQLKNQQNEYQILEETLQNEKLELQQQVSYAQQKINQIEAQLINKEEQYKNQYSIYQAVQKENKQQKRNLEPIQEIDEILPNNMENKNQTLLQQQIIGINKQNIKHKIIINELDFSQDKQQFQNDQITPKQFSVDTISINNPKLQTLQCPIQFKHFPLNQQFSREEVPQRQKTISHENLLLIYPYDNPQEYFNNKPQKKRKGKEISFIQDFYNISHLSQENQAFFKQRCLGSQGILYVHYGMEFGLSYQTQVSQNKSYFTYGLYIKNIERGKTDIKVEFKEIEKFQQFWASSFVFSKQLDKDCNELIEMLVEQDMIHQEVLTVNISLSENKQFLISIPIFICQQIIYAEIKTEDFKVKWKKKNNNIIRTSQLQLNKYIVKDIQNFLKLIPKMIILNQNKIQDFQQGVAAIKLGGIGKFQDIQFLIKFEILPNDNIYIFLSFQSGLSASQKDKLDKILKGYALIFGQRYT